MKILLAPDSFKGTLSATEVCALLKETILAVSPDAAVTSLPIADGGEGTVDAFLQIFGGKRVTVRACSPLQGEVDAAYAILPDGTAVIETAAASGIAVEAKNEYGVDIILTGDEEIIKKVSAFRPWRTVFGWGRERACAGGRSA